MLGVAARWRCLEAAGHADAALLVCALRSAGGMLGRRHKKSPQAKGQGAAVAKQVRKAKGRGAAGRAARSDLAAVLREARNYFQLPVGCFVLPPLVPSS